MKHLQSYLILAQLLLLVFTWTQAFGTIGIFSIEIGELCFDFKNHSEQAVYVEIYTDKLQGMYVLVEALYQKPKTNSTNVKEFIGFNNRHFVNMYDNIDLTITSYEGHYAIFLTYQKKLAKQGGNVIFYEASSREGVMDIKCTYHIASQKEIFGEYEESPDLKTLAISRRGKRREPRSTTPVDGKEYHIEIFVVHDRAMFLDFYSDEYAVRNRTFELINALDTIYRPHNIRLSLVGIEIWTDTDKVNITADYNKVLEDFSLYTMEDKFSKADHVHLITGHLDFDDHVAGLAYVSYMCSKKWSTGFTTDTRDSSVQTTASIFAHELGHNLGMNHDESSCTCASAYCFMHPSVAIPTPKHFSSCSLDNLFDFLTTFKSSCLMNEPASKLMSPTTSCGNNIVDNGEECDCGGEYFCTNPCCDPKTCLFTEGSQCSEGECCKECKIQAAGIVCRDIEDTECDLQDFCDGKTTDCRNVYKENNVRCDEDRGACYDGTCKSRRRQCQFFWGEGATEAPDICYSNVNILGAWYGHCSNDTNYKKCPVEDVMCGTLQCINKPVTYPEVGWKRGYGVLSLTNSDGSVQKCEVGKAELGKSQPNPGSVFDWTPCGADKYCINHKCLPMPFQTKCEHTCINGVCTNYGFCRCTEGWVGENCTAASQLNESATTPPPIVSTTTNKPGLFDGNKTKSGSTTRTTKAAIVFWIASLTVLLEFLCYVQTLLV